MAWSQSGTYLATGAQDGQVRMYLVLRARGGLLRSNAIRTFDAHTAAVLHMAFSRGDFLLTASMDRSVRLWHVDTQLCLRRFAHADMVTAVAFHPTDENYMVSGGCDGMVRVWRPADHACVAEKDVGGVVTAVEFAVEGGSACVGTYDGRAVVLDVKGVLGSEGEEKEEGEEGVWHGGGGCLEVRKTIDVSLKRRRKVGTRVEGVARDRRLGEMVVKSSDGGVHMLRGSEMDVVSRFKAMGKKETKAVRVGGGLSADGRFLLHDAVGGVLRIMDLAQGRAVEAGLKGRKKEREVGVSVEGLNVGGNVSCAAFATANAMNIAMQKREGTGCPMLVAVGDDDGTVRIVFAPLQSC